MIRRKCTPQRSQLQTQSENLHLKHLPYLLKPTLPHPYHPDLHHHHKPFIFDNSPCRTSHVPTSTLSSTALPNASSIVLNYMDHLDLLDPKAKLVTVMKLHKSSIHAG